MTTAQLTLTFEAGIQFLANVTHLPCGFSLSIVNSFCKALRQTCNTQRSLSH